MNRREIMTRTLVSAGLALLGLGAASTRGAAYAAIDAERLKQKVEGLVSVPNVMWERGEAEAKLIPVFDVRPEDEQFDLATRVFHWVRPSVAVGGRPIQPDFPWIRTGDGWIRWPSVGSAPIGHLPPLAESTVYMTTAALRRLWSETLARAATDSEPNPRIFDARIEVVDWSDKTGYAVSARTESGHTTVEQWPPQS